MDTRPFNLTHAQAGAPYACRDGTEATVLKWESRREDRAILGVYGASDDAALWRTNGAFAAAASLKDLVMLPLGYIDGQPVFTGDALHRCGSGYSDLRIAAPTDREFGDWFLSIPLPEPTPLPKLAITDQLLSQIFSRRVFSGPADASRFVANAIFHHALDSGQVVPLNVHADEMTRASLHGQELVRQRDAKRDMAIAKAVRHACYMAAAKSIPPNYLRNIIAGIK